MSSLPALAELEDIPGSEGFTQDQRVQAAVALERASTVVRSYCRRQFTRQSYTQRLRAQDRTLLLRERPVVSVESVGVMVYGHLTTTTGWVWDGLDRVWIGNLGMVINLAEDLLDAVRYGITVAEVTYTAGYDVVPDEIVEVTASLAGRAVSIPQGGLVTQQTAGPFSYSVASWATGGPLSLSQAEKDMLGPFRRGGATIELRS